MDTIACIRTDYVHEQRKESYVGEKSVNDGDAKASVLRLITGNKKASASEIAKMLSVTQRTVERYIRELREEGRLVRHGSARGGYWKVIKK